jgi:uncharacterized membrane protein
LTEHTEPTNRSLHFVFDDLLGRALSDPCRGTSIIVAILIQNPALIFALIGAGSTGVILSSVLQGLEHGLAEAAVLMLVYILLSFGLGKKLRLVSFAAG